MLFNLCFCMVLSLGSCGVIIPEELPSLLSVAYSNVPPIKKGTDSRVGFGFAFGNHADVQVVFELGPQTNTQNLTGQGFQQSNAKRQANYGPYNKINRNKEKYQNQATSYLQSWAQKMKQPPPGDTVMNLEDSVVELKKNEKGEYEIHQPAPAHVSGTVMEHLKRLYGQKKEEAKRLTEKKKEEDSKRSAEQIKKITEDLSNVDLD